MRKAIYRSCCVAVAALVLGVSHPMSGAAQTPAAPFMAKAQQAYMVDAETGTVLLSQNENQSFPPASLAKLMTVELALDALSNGQVTPETAYPVSEYAWRTGGAPSRTSTMFAALKSSVGINDLLTGIIVQNANDGCIILAEGMAGTDSAFAKRMTERAGELGMNRSTFANSTGLPDPGNQTTAKDMVRLAQHLRDAYSDRYGLFTRPDFEWNRIFQRNKNTLLGGGIDGLGLGFAEGHGFAAVVSAERDGRRVFLALAGMTDDKTRQEEARRVVEWGLTAFEKRHLFSRNEAVGTISVYGGNASYVDLSPKEDVSVLVPVSNPERISGRIVYRWPLNAPLDAGANAGTLRIFSGERLLKEVPLYTKVAVGEGSLPQNAAGALKELLLFWL